MEMTGKIEQLSPRKTAGIAGIGYLIIIVTGIFAEFFVRSKLIVPGDAAATAANIMGSESIFRIGIAGEIVMLIFDVIVAVALYLLLKPVSKGLALLATSFRLVHSAVSGINLLNQVIVLLILGGTGYAAAFNPEQISNQTMLFLNAHNYGYIIGLIFFGIHCLILGYLVYRSEFIPAIFGIFLMVASLGYLTDGFANILMSNYNDYKSLFMAIVAGPAIIAELSFCLWLLIKGVRVRKSLPEPLPA